MILCRVLGPVVATVHHPAFDRQTMLVVQPVDEHQKPLGKSFLAVDRAQAGEGDLVLVLREGTGIRQLFEKPDLPIRSAIVGIVDAVEVAR